MSICKTQVSDNISCNFVAVHSYKIASVSRQLGSIYQEALDEVRTTNSKHYNVSNYLQVSTNMPALYPHIEKVLSTPCPLPSTYSKCQMSSLLKSVEQILLANLPRSDLPASILGIIISKVQLTLMACKKLSSLPNTPSSKHLETAVKECQETNYGDVSWCFKKTREVFMENWGETYKP